ncbi:Bifunctional inhibitor/lipid-transfer protein/seed storage 2S albumin superfamily protein [Trifolium repens]|jgi:hypothetical protein|nr:Bifunctional inhibitor/lipid-transfer protein/seed storage 2S albumin superfamily protein [Trifolium repens]
MGSKSNASITILILSLSIFFFTTLTSAQVPPSTTCPDLNVCASALNNLANVRIPSPQTQACCSLIAGLTDANAAVCLCPLAPNVLGINLNLLVQALLTACGRDTSNIPACA